ncbi:MAG: hypothetical protein A7315_11125 [Candidatus Altiarchaeales archaeon WOR_SM1_79]|nr:MAG: hypothetical protein A7315_11125 [Candidatus Altiarchaeales archaeon WOR_SM1_79]
MVLALWLFGERWRLMRPSTWKLVREGGLRRFLDLGSLHGYIYLRWNNQYVKLLLNYIAPCVPSGVRKHVSRWVAEHYHCKVITHEQAGDIITLDLNIPLRDLEQVIPYSMARDLVLKGPPDVAVCECPCRHARADPCLPTQVCMLIGQPFVDFILEHNPKSSRLLTQTEALELLRAEHERGHLHTAWFKDAMLGRFYAICNCCKCCCGGIEAMKRYGAPMLASSGYVARVDETVCTGCGICEEACPFGAVKIDGIAYVNREKCMGCGVCAGQCPGEAVSLVRDEKKCAPLDVRLLAQKQAEM